MSIDRQAIARRTPEDEQARELFEYADEQLRKYGICVVSSSEKALLKKEDYFAWRSIASPKYAAWPDLRINAWVKLGDFFREFNPDDYYYIFQSAGPKLGPACFGVAQSKDKPVRNIPEATKRTTSRDKMIRHMSKIFPIEFDEKNRFCVRFHWGNRYIVAANPYVEVKILYLGPAVERKTFEKEVEATSIPLKRIAPNSLVSLVLEIITGESQLRFAQRFPI